ncbi:MAG: YihY/virulence factor BrkB family protein [Ruminococcus sp.]|jgi:membrane protein|nr:YihY/virulence factor BrkB family protein [Ruminococcus sp.]
MKKLIRHIKHFLNKNKRDNISAMSGQSAFFIILSFVPFLMFMFAVSSMIFDFAGMSRDLLREVLSETGANWLNGIIYEAYHRSSTVAIYTIIIALWSAGKGIYSITDGIKRIYRLPDRHFWVLKRIFAMGYTIVLFLSIALLMIAVVLFSTLDDYIKPFLSAMPFAEYVSYTLIYIAVFIVLTLLLNTAMKLFLMRKVSNKKYVKFRTLLPGTALTSLLWILFLIGITIYSRLIGSSPVYGSLGAVIIVMIWVYFSMYILLCGVQLNYIYREVFANFRFKNIFKKKKDND